MNSNCLARNCTILCSIIEVMNPKRARIFISRSSSGDLPMRISSSGSWPSRASAIENRIVRSSWICWPNCAWSLFAVCLQCREHWLSRFRTIWWSLSDHIPSEMYFERISRSRPGRSFLEKRHSRIRFDLFNFSNGPHTKDMLTWKANSST
jgi:hypothetical protein